MILKTMLQRLYASLTSGPALNARPHHSRQRVDLIELRHLASTDPASALAALLGPPAKAVEFPAKVAPFKRPERDEGQWTPEQKSARDASDRQERVLGKLRDIAGDATDYYNDHGEHALFLGFPLLSLPPVRDREGFRSTRVLAPVAFVPLDLQVRRGAKPGVTLLPSGEGSDLVQPNPGLLAWIEQQTGTDTDALFADETGDDPWREIVEIVALAAKAAGVESPVPFDPRAPLRPVPRTDELPDTPTILPCAVLGLFPLANPGLLRDTKWMIEGEASLQNPVRAFLSPAALAEPEPDHLPETQEYDHAAAPARAPRDFAQQLLVTHADPCQTEAVTQARSSAALVIHGPPGTGKSQTIANVIGDHLARGERVLFVCDKRTALDVVKYRLDSMGLGALCGVIHDPQRDRRDLYLKLRQTLEDLAQSPVLPDSSRELALVNRRLNELHGELRGYFDRLHGAGGGAASFHHLCGEWLQLRQSAGADLPEVDGLTIELLQTHRADAEEVLRRALRARWPENPFRGRLGVSLPQWLASDANQVRRALQQVAEDAAVLDRTAAESLPPLAPDFTAAEQAAARRALADQLEVVVRRGRADLAARAEAVRQLRGELDSLSAEGERLSTPLDRELYLQVKGAIPPLAEASRRLLALDQWATLATSWKRFFAFSAKRQAVAALTPLALPLAPEAIERGRAFYRGLKARHLWTDLRDRVLGVESPTPPPDEELIACRDALPEVLRVLDAAAQPIHAGVRALVESALASLKEAGTATVATLRNSGARADAIHKLESSLLASGLFAERAIANLSAGWRAASPPLGSSRGHETQTSGRTGDQSLVTSTATVQGARHDARVESPALAAPVCQLFLDHADMLEEAIRLTDRLGTLPPPLREALDHAAIRGLPWEDAEPALRAAALAREIRRRLREDEALARIDTQRVEAAFSELVQRTEEKCGHVRALVLHRWQKIWRERLLAMTGTRLNSDGAALRQRLFVRGQKAMKLRQMIAAGASRSGAPSSGSASPASAEDRGEQELGAPNGGDPLFDLCPVWMASPATVAQIFPREALFDVVIFDEASQCRLEEALPVLLRGRRVVIAGDPKQLPPTRFFEQSLAESDDTAAETAEEVFVQQQSEAEDLLAAALNLNVQEAFLDVHYRSRNEALIGFSNDAFYGSRLQPIPGHPRNKALQTPIRLVRVDGLYKERGNEAEARAAANLVAELLDEKEPPSIGVACFNLNQRDLILDALEEKAAADATFAARLEAARQRRGRDSFEGLFVKNLENVQGDERDHIIISTTFGPDAEGKFRRNFGALSRAGGERRLNVLVTRAREAIHVLTSIPRAEYLAPEPAGEGQRPTGRHQLYAYLRYAERLDEHFENWQKEIETARRGHESRCEVAPTTRPSPVAEALGRTLFSRHGIGSTVYWGNDGFCIDVALTHPELPADVTVGVLADFTRYLKTPDPIAWEQFRSMVLAGQGWKLHRLWSPALFRDAAANVATVCARHLEAAGLPAASVGQAPRLP